MGFILDDQKVGRDFHFLREHDFSILSFSREHIFFELTIDGAAAPR
jgi:hypothetical protein